MARVAEMSGAPTEPLSDRAAEFALEFNELVSVLFAIILTDSDCLCGALTTDQFFRLEVLFSLFVILFTILLSSEVNVFALETLIIG